MGMPDIIRLGEAPSKPQVALVDSRGEKTSPIGGKYYTSLI